MDALQRRLIGEGGVALCGSVFPYTAREMPNHLSPLVAGREYGRLTVLRRVANSARAARWLCRCRCNREVVLDGFRVYSGHTQSCGCQNSDRARAQCQALTTHGHTRVLQRTRTYVSYRAMMARCHNPNDPSFFRYGARGISVTKPWRDDFAAFLNDMGERPALCSIDRIDNRFGYFAANCRWSTAKEQRANQVRIEAHPWQV